MLKFNQYTVQSTATAIPIALKYVLHVLIAIQSTALKYVHILIPFLQPCCHWQKSG